MQAVRTYTHALKELEGGELKAWKDKAPSKIARTYWGLKETDTMRDLLLAVRLQSTSTHIPLQHSIACPNKDS